MVLLVAAKTTMPVAVANRSPPLAFSIQMRLQSGRNRSEIEQSKIRPISVLDSLSVSRIAHAFESLQSIGRFNSLVRAL